LKLSGEVLREPGSNESISPEVVQKIADGRVDSAND
jgi:hypothetical protein